MYVVSYAVRILPEAQHNITASGKKNEMAVCNRP